MSVETLPTVTPLALGGGLEGAEKTSRETLNWNVSHTSPDLLINPVKEEADARARDTIQNDGYSRGVVQIHKDSIVGHQFRLNSEPDTETLKSFNKAFDEIWAEEFQTIVENRFNLIGDSAENWLDASRHNSLTALVRLAVTGFLMTGEVFASCEWLKTGVRPCKTAIQMISPDRLSNPNGVQDTKRLRRGVVRDKYGAPESYWIRTSHPSEAMFYPDINAFTWKNVKAVKPWGRRNIIHIIEQLEPDQTRGISDMVAVLKEMRMTRKFQEITLQKAVVNATYAGAIESELPSDAIFGAMGGTNNGYNELLQNYMTALAEYVGNSKAIAIDGVKIPHLFPGTKLSIKPVAGEGDVGTDFEQSLLRHICSPLGLSYEQFSRDYTRTNYSSARASMAETWKYMQSRKGIVADKFATYIFTLWFEEEIHNGNVPLPSGVTSKIFYDPVLREALCSCSWIGASRGQIDEMKESQSSILRINSGISTYQEECANLGKDFRKVFKQRAREKAMMEELGLSFDMTATKPGSNQRLQIMQDETEEQKENAVGNSIEEEDDEQSSR
jgi:lambda family phage portal protein